MDFPDEIQAYIENHLLEKFRLFCVAVDTANITIGVWGDPSAHGVQSPQIGSDASEVLPLLRDFGHAESMLLPFLSFARNRHSHVHLFPHGATRYVLMLDARDEARSQRGQQQVANELRLAYYRQGQLVDQLVDARAELDTRRREAEERSRAQSELVATLSHEVRTPLTSILGYVDLLTDEGAVAGPHLPAIRRGAQQLLELVNQLLNRARSDAVGTTAKPAVFDPATLMMELTEVIAPLAAEKGLGFSAIADGVLPQFVRADRVRMRQVLVNLLSNAVKYTTEGSIRLTAKFEDDALIFSVQDTGVGIDKNDQRKIFKAFERLATTERNPGAGLGLAIAMQLAHRLDGHLDLESEPGKGSTFRFSVPSPAVTTAADQPATRILVVEDDQDIRDLVTLQLSRAGYTAESVGSGNEAIEMVRRSAPDLIIMDLRMSGKSGIEAARDIRDAGFPAPIVALSASREAAEIEAALAAGFSDYLFKPLDRHELVAAVERALNSVQV